jgi:hypothetical protein
MRPIDPVSVKPVAFCRIRREGRVVAQIVPTGVPVRVCANAL